MILCQLEMLFCDFLNSCLYPIPITQITFTDILFRIFAREKKVKNCKKLPIKKKIITHPSFTQTQNKNSKLTLTVQFCPPPWRIV